MVGWLTSLVFSHLALCGLKPLDAERDIKPNDWQVKNME